MRNPRMSRAPLHRDGRERIAASAAPPRNDMGWESRARIRPGSLPELERHAGAVEGVRPVETGESVWSGRQKSKHRGGFIVSPTRYAGAPFRQGGRRWMGADPSGVGAQGRCSAPGCRGCRPLGGEGEERPLREGQERLGKNRAFFKSRCNRFAQMRCL